MEIALTAGALVTAVLTFFVVNAAYTRAARTGSYGVALGSSHGVDWREGDPTGIAARLPPIEGVARRPLRTGAHDHRGRAAVFEETSDRATELVFHVWWLTPIDADVVRRPDGTVERTHGSRNSRGDRVVRAIADRVPEAHVVWCRTGDVAAVGLALDAELMTNPVAWTRWIELVTKAIDQGTEPPDPPAVGFG